MGNPYGLAELLGTVMNVVLIMLDDKGRWYYMEMSNRQVEVMALEVRWEVVFESH